MTPDYPELPETDGVFVTGTDTGVGKTVIAGAIAVVLKNLGIDVDVFKPVASGCLKRPGGMVSEDGMFLAACADSRRSLAEITPARLARALAPNTAAMMEGRDIDLELVFQEYKRTAETAGAVVVEGTGGILCPISDDFSVLDFAAMTGLPMVIVARPDLGTINHTLLTLQAARSAGIRVAGVIINRYIDELYTEGQPLGGREDGEVARLTNPRQISLLGRIPVLAVVMEDPDTSVSDAKLGECVVASVGNADWLKIIKS